MNKVTKLIAGSAVGLSTLALAAIPTFASTNGNYNNYNAHKSGNYYTQKNSNSNCNCNNNNSSSNYMKNYKMMMVRYYNKHTNCYMGSQPIWQMGNNMYGWFDRMNSFHTGSLASFLQSNNATVSNTVNVYSSTGGNIASFNTGGDVTISTGDSNVTVTISNNVNSNSIGL